MSPSPFPFHSAGRLLSHFSAERLADFGLAFSAHWLIIRLGLDSWDREFPVELRRPSLLFSGVQRRREKRAPACALLSASPRPQLPI